LIWVMRGQVKLVNLDFHTRPYQLADQIS